MAGTFLLLACFIIILVAIFTCFMFLFMFDVRLSYHNKRLLTYLLTYLFSSVTLPVEHPACILQQLPTVHLWEPGLTGLTC